MKNSNSLRYRSLLLRGATALAISSLLLYGTGCRGGEDTGTEVIQPTTTTEVMTTCTTSTSTSSTMSFTTTTTETETTTITTMAETISMTQPITESQTIAIVIEETPVVEEISEPVATYPITEYERILLCNIVANEAGSDWISIYDKASVVACVINRVNSPDFPNTIEGVLTQPYQFSGYYASGSYYSTVTDACIQAVDYYFSNPNEFGYWLYFEGNGMNNYFH